MDQAQHELLLFIEFAIVKLEKKKRKTALEQEVYEALLQIRIIVKREADKTKLDILVDFVKNIFKGF
jgi:hypothetical protein